MDRDILHVDMNGFYASVEMLSHPEARDVPMAVGGDREERHGIILAKNELAKRRGVKTAETIWQAKQKCPELLLLPPHHDLYHEYYLKANAIYGRYTDLVEPASIDESYLDVTGSHKLFGSSYAIADSIRRTVKEELGLTVSVGVSFCKYFAKMGSDLKKPDAVTVVSRANYQQLLYPLPIGEMLSVGAVTAARLRQRGVHTIGDLAARSRQDLTAWLGKHGQSLYEAVHGLDMEPVRRQDDHDDPKSIGRGRTFRSDLRTEEEIRVEVLALSEDVAERLRRQDMRCWGVQLTIKNPEFVSIDRQTRLTEPGDTTLEIYSAAMEVFHRVWRVGKPIRMMTVTAINLTRETRQLSLFDDGRTEKLTRSVDQIKEKFGRRANRPASLLKKEE